MAQESFNLSEPFTPNASIVPTPTQVQTAHEIYATPDSGDFYTPECTSNTIRPKANLGKIDIVANCASLAERKRGMCPTENGIVYYTLS